MARDSWVSFDDLVAHRQELHSFCSLHYESLMRFRQGRSFKLYEGEILDDTEVHNLTSTATCIASLIGCPEALRPKNDLNKLARDFSSGALQRPQKKWLSEKSAPIYCRCRTLPFVVKHIPTYDDVIREHLQRIFWQVTKDPKRLAIGEVSKGARADPSNWYPENAFHTYWTLYLLDAIEERFQQEFERICSAFRRTGVRIDQLRAQMLTWARESVGYQAALHASGSPT